METAVTVSQEQREREVIKMRLDFASVIAEAGKRENDGLQVYYNILDRLTPYWVENPEDAELKKFKADIEEIISDELNHISKLQKWAIKLGGVRENPT